MKTRIKMYNFYSLEYYKNYEHKILQYYNVTFLFYRIRFQE